MNAALHLTTSSRPLREGRSFWLAHFALCCAISSLLFAGNTQCAKLPLENEPPRKNVFVILPANLGFEGELSFVQNLSAGLDVPDKVELYTESIDPAQLTTPQDAQKLADFYAQRTLTKRPILPQDCANAIIWLAGEQSGKTTGHVIPVDGGLSEAFLR